MGKHRRKVVLTLFGLPETDQPEAVRRDVMRCTWADPLDDKPTARRTARQIEGWRRYDPVRMHVRRFGALVFSPEMIDAADRLRLDHDGAVIGFTGGCDAGLPITSATYRPSTGPTTTALRQLRAASGFEHAWALIEDQRDRTVTALVVLQNRSFTFAAKVLVVPRDGLSDRLAGVLTTLHEHYDEQDGHRRAA